MDKKANHSQGALKDSENLLDKDVYRDSILSFEVELSTSRRDVHSTEEEPGKKKINAGNDDAHTNNIYPEQLGHYWLMWPIAFLVFTLSSVLYICFVPLADPKSGLNKNFVYLVVHVGLFQSMLYASLQIMGNSLFSGFADYDAMKTFNLFNTITRSLLCGILSVSSYYYLSIFINTFPLPLGFFVSIGGMILQSFFEIAVNTILYICQYFIGAENRLNAKKKMAFQLHIMIVMVMYTFGWGLAVIFLFLYKDLATPLQLIFTFVLIAWKTALPLFIPYFLKKILRFKNSSSTMEGFLASSIHMYWTLIGTLCFSSMTTEVFVLYFVMDILSALMTASKGSKTTQRIKEDAKLKFVNIVAKHRFFDTSWVKEPSNVDLKHERTYYTAVFVVNTLGEILIPCCIGIISYFSAKVKYWSHNRDFLRFFYYCLIMSFSDVLVLVLVWSIYKKRHQRNIFHPLSYAVKMEIKIPFVFTIAFMLPLLLILPVHSGVGVV